MWSPSGHHIAYAQDGVQNANVGQAAIWTTDRNGRNHRRIYAGPRYDSELYDGWLQIDWQPLP